MVLRLDLRDARCMTRTANLGTAPEIADAVRSGRTTAAEIIRTHLARIDEVDGSLAAFRSVRHDAALRSHHDESARARLG